MEPVYFLVSLMVPSSLLIVSFVAPAGPAFVVLVSHLGKVVSDHLTVFDADGPHYSCSQQLYFLRHGRIGRQAGCDVDVVLDGLALLIFKDLGKAVEQREPELRVVAVSC